MDLFCKEHHQLVQAIFDLAAKDGCHLTIKENDLKIRRRAGRICDVNLSAVTTQIQNQAWLVLTLQDLTEIRHQENEREKLIEETARVSKLADIGRLAAGMAHELNNPLAILMGYVENLSINVQEPHIDKEKVLEDIIPIERAAQRMSKVITKMLSKMRNEPQVLKPTSLRRIVEDTLALLEGILASQSISLEVEVEDCWIQCDGTSIEQILTNIVTNACNALESQKERKLRVRADSKGQMVRVEVWNNGSAIPEEVRPKLFTPFFTTKAVGEGTGLGLYMSYQIMKAHQGELSFDSDSERGTSFYMTFPQIKRPSMSINPVGLRALIVDDDTFFRKLMCKKLEKLGVQCTESRDGQEALGVICQSDVTFDMVLLDFKMPRMDGLRFLQELSARKIEVPVVLISGALSMSELKEQMKVSNLYAAIAKPVENSELEILVDNIALEAAHKKTLQVS